MGNRESHQRAGGGPVHTPPPLHGQKRESEEKKMASAPPQPSPSHRQEEEKEEEEKRARALAERKERVSYLVKQQKKCLQDMEYCIQNHLVAIRRTLSLSILDPFFTAYEEIYQILRDTMPQLESCLNDELKLGEVTSNVANQLQTPLTTLYRLWGQFRQAYCSSYKECESQAPHPLTHYLGRPEDIIANYYHRLIGFIIYSRKGGVEAGSAESALEVVRTIWNQLQDCKRLSLLEGGVREEWGSLVLQNDLYLREGEGEWEKEEPRVFLFTTTMVITRTEKGPDGHVYKYTIRDCVNLQDATITEGRDSEGDKTGMISDQSRGKKFTMRNRWADSRTQKWLLKLQELTVQAQEKADEDKIDVEALYAEAIEKGYVLCHLIKLILIGHAGVGKTHVKFFLLGKLPPLLRQSTPLAERPVRAVRAMRHKGGELLEEEEEWIEVTLEQLTSLLADALRAGVPLEDITIRVQYLPTEEAATNVNSSQVSAGGEDHTPSQESEEPKSKFPHHHHPNLHSLLEVEEDVVRLMEKSSGSKKLLETQWIYFIDSGGQPQFHHILPAFVRNNHFTIFVLKLSEKLGDYPLIEYYSEGKLCAQPIHSTLTNEQIIQHSLRAMNAGPTDAKESSSHILCIGTHRDLEHTCQESRREKNDKLLSMLSPGLRKQLVFYGEQMKEPIFPINAKIPAAVDKQIAQQVRRAIIHEARDIKPVKIPIPWYLLELALRKLAAQTGVRILKKEQCLQVAQKLHLNHESLEAALQFFHSLSIFFYYPKVLPNVVFCDSEALLGKVSELVHHSFRLRNAPEEGVSCPGKWIAFRDHGYIMPSLLKEFPADYVPGVFEPRDFLEILEHLLLVGKVMDGTYFMPSLLYSHPEQSSQRHCAPPASPKAAPLLLHFKEEVPGNGIFPSLIAYLLSQKKWEIAQQSGSPVCITANCITLQYPETPCTVTVIDSYKYFELHVAGPPSEISPQLCFDIQRAMLSGIKTVTESLEANLCEPQQAFLCSACPHAHTVSRSGQLLLCNQSPSKCYTNIMDRHTIWLSTRATVKVQSCGGGGGVGGATEDSNIIHKQDRPKLTQLLRFPAAGKRDVVNIVEKIATSYSDFGTFLLKDDEGTKVPVIAEANHHKPVDITKAILHGWLAGKGMAPVTWETLITCLRYSRLNLLANDIEATLES